MAVPFDLAHEVVGLERTSGSAWFIDGDGSGPPRIDGYTVGAPAVTGDSPHNGEMHPDADELLYIVSGRVRVHLELTGGDRTVAVAAGQGLVVPHGVWHRILVDEPGQLVHITPGPNGQHRPLGA